MRGDEVGERVVEEGGGVVRGAEGAGGEDVRAELEVEEAGFEVDEAGAEGEVRGGQGAEGREAVEEDVDGDLEAGLGEGEDVFGREEGEGAQEEDEGDGEEEDEGARDGGGGWADRAVVEARGVADGAVVGDGFGEEDGAEEDEEGLDAAREGGRC